MSTYNVPGVSEMCYSCSELRLVMHFPIKLSSLTLSLFNSASRGPCPEPGTQGFMFFRVPPGAWDGTVQNWQCRLDRYSEPGPGPVCAPVYISHLLGAPQNSTAFAHCGVYQMPRGAPELTPTRVIPGCPSFPWFSEGSPANV